MISHSIDGAARVAGQHHDPSESSDRKEEYETPFSIGDFRSYRVKVNPTQWGVAAPSTSEQFKLRSHAHKPRALRWDHRISTESARRTGSTLKSALKHLKNPDVISLGGGLPLSDYFPFKGMDLAVPAIHQPGKHRTEPNNSDSLHTGKNDLADGLGIYDLATALNYCQGNGSAQLLRWITEHTEMVHDPPYADWQCTMTIGNTSALDMALRMFAKPGDYVLSEEYTFATAVETVMPMQVKFAGVKMDEEGMLPESLHDLLENWDSATFGGARKPFLLYTVPTGQNPTGATQSAKRRKDIYNVAQQHDLFILEDDPYYFLQMKPFTAGSKVPLLPADNIPSSHLLDTIVPSFLSLDVDGRVMRMDSFSKVISPGTRLGWITASHQIVERYKNHADVSTQGPSGLSQLALFKLLDEYWGHAGYFDWLMYMREEYTKRRDFIIEACDRYLPKTIVSWNPPMAGMFLWLKVDWNKHHNARTKQMTDIEEEIWLGCIKHGSLVARGSWFYAESGKNHNDMFFRLTFAAAPLDKVEEAVRRLGLALNEILL
ncbi:pyridoxal phosphate-dependent transferase [Halenospora varia]|nr:pyridoxal phosphate-dependent transferase [Halenospora varia]